MVLEHEVGNHQDEDRPLDAKALTQAIVDKIPTQKDDLFKFQIEWDIVDAVCYLFNLFKLFIYLFISFIYLCLLIS
jgi:hypothetical protein